jgi:hypothetical protein
MEAFAFEKAESGEIRPRKETIKCMGFESIEDSAVVGSCLIQTRFSSDAIDLLYSIEAGMKNHKKVVSVKYFTTFGID